MKHWQKWRDENELLTQRNRRRRQLFKWSVIIVGVCSALLYLGLIASVYEKSIGHTPSVLPVPALPDCTLMPRQNFSEWSAHCMSDNKILHPDQSEDRIPGDIRWMGLPPAPLCNHTKSHRMWAECMGVGYRDTKVDRYLYLHREDD